MSDDTASFCILAGIVFLADAVVSLVQVATHMGAQTLGGVVSCCALFVAVALLASRGSYLPRGARIGVGLVALAFILPNIVGVLFVMQVGSSGGDPVAIAEQVTTSPLMRAMGIYYVISMGASSFLVLKAGLKPGEDPTLHRWVPPPSDPPSGRVRDVAMPSDRVVSSETPARRGSGRIVSARGSERAPEACSSCGRMQTGDRSTCVWCGTAMLAREPGEALTSPPAADSSSAAVQFPRCPYCHTDVQPGRAEAKTSCVNCMAWLHRSCWVEYGGCPACGEKVHTGSPAAPTERIPEQRFEVIHREGGAGQRESLIEWRVPLALLGLMAGLWFLAWLLMPKLPHH